MCTEQCKQSTFMDLTQIHNYTPVYKQVSYSRNNHAHMQINHIEQKHRNEFIATELLVYTGE